MPLIRWHGLIGVSCPQRVVFGLRGEAAICIDHHFTSVDDQKPSQIQSMQMSDSMQLCFRSLIKGTAFLCIPQLCQPNQNGPFGSSREYSPIRGLCVHSMHLCTSSPGAGVFLLVLPLVLSENGFRGPCERHGHRPITGILSVDLAN